MKAAVSLFILLLLFGLEACSVAETDANAVGQRFQEGIQGRGSIVPNNPTSDSFGSDYR